MADLIVRSRRVLTPDGLRPAAVHVAGGRIAAVTDSDHAADTGADEGAGKVVDAGDAVVMPGLVDTHVHVNDPGREHWEGFDAATRAAAAGGVTTLLDMPLNSIPPTTTLEGLEVKRAAAERRCWVDVGFWGGAVPGNAAALEALHAAGVFGFKCFLAPSGVDEFPCVHDDDLRVAAAAVAELGSLLLVHAESPGPLAAAGAALSTEGADPRRYATYLRSRPPEAEEQAVAGLLGIARETGCRMHVVHLAAASALPALRAARTGGVEVSVETCPHYLALAAEDVPDGATEHKCAPPVRGRGNRDALWAGLRAGDIDVVVTDHSPCPPELKLPDSGDFLRAWGGISSLQLGLAVTWTAARERGVGLAEVVGWMGAAPARLVGLDRKGSLAPGKDADLVVWDPDTQHVVDPAALHSRHPVTPYAGRRLSGRVEATYVRGVEVYRNGRFGPSPSGTLLRREAA